MLPNTPAHRLRVLKIARIGRSVSRDLVQCLRERVDGAFSSAITETDIVRVLDALQEDFEYVVVDTAPFFEERVLAALDWADDILLLGSMDLSTLKNLGLTLASMELMSYSPDKIHVIMNRSDSKVGLELADVERHLGRAVSHSISSSVEVPRALNAGEVISVQKQGSKIAQELKHVIDEYGGGTNGAGSRRFGFRRKQ